MHDEATAILGHVRQRQAIPSPESASSEMAESELRYVLETSEPTNRDQLETRLVEVLDVEFQLSNLFTSPDREAAGDRNDEEDDDRYFLLQIPGTSVAELPRSPYALTYRLVDALGLRSADPDIDDRFYPQSPETGAAVAVPESVGGCWGSNPVPTDKHWAPKKIRANDAWALSQQAGRPAEGEGILIAQPDTGVSAHGELESGIFDLTRSWNFVEDNDDPTDPLINLPGLDNPGHGTATASVLGSRAAGHIVGSAPAATIVPIRATKSVAIFGGSRVAQAINHARAQGCHVITMSLGGLFSWAVRHAVKRAVDDNLIVLAAAGNCVKLVVWPARLNDCLAIAGINVDDQMWQGTSCGRSVDVSAPAEQVWRARISEQQPGTDQVAGGQGTSFAVALTAGVAGLWLAHFGRQQLIDSLAGGETLQERFRAALKNTARVPAGWVSDKLGAGIVDAHALLSLNPFSIAQPEAVLVSGAGSSVSSSVDESVAMADLAPSPESASAEGLTEDHYQSELSYLALRHASNQSQGPSLESTAESAPHTRFAASRRIADAVQDSGNIALQTLVLE